ncbi:MAG: Trehalose/maltose import ATP-binding protein MalK [Candidatus Methanofastidiosum methylothiophilum]|uniref:Trehalose/maltose import ATP-binding protein MalK n=1 Tax=Candidatus Methanofastidiosum methylothiophilum TaxID=1705564 RepID=A0A150ITQ0_9EURY|nr:MAG: Trehalose/maltose import ATP-binding protein MalK [Candidatus Methanofastidiosum methylthiophilus]KYC48356.1 MAG: Trehalose/maltose import ATP-binding protein MalK [Candidatus Methanofastidiosum methylthiophilus]KYC50779.1 MAG: Trehalose/maltose import ATP-binding protein MalK [Candidatus Methanofastidiosum methylthiophilus]
MKILEIDNITKKYNTRIAVDNFSLNAESGKIYGFLGPNGAGKTTTIRMIMGIIEPDSGKIKVFGEKLSESTKKRIGYIPEERGLYRKYRVSDLLHYFGKLKGLSSEEAKRNTDMWLEKVGLKDRANSKIEELSKGMQQNIQLIVSLINDPDLIILDEPFVGLDPINTRNIKEIIYSLKDSGKTIIFSTHQMNEAERLCDHIFLINKGRKIIDGPLDDVKKKYSKNFVSVEFQNKVPNLEDIGIVEKVYYEGNKAEIELRKNTNYNDLLELLMKRGDIKKYEISESSLESIFVEVVTDGI